MSRSRTHGAAPQPHAPSPQRPHSTDPADSKLAGCVERFRQAARDLLVAYELETVAAQPDQLAVSSLELRSRMADQRGMIRACYLSARTRRREEELLRYHRAEDMRGPLDEIHLQLAALVKMMKCTPPNIRVRGHVIAGLGCLLEPASALVLRMRNIYDQVEFIEV